MGGAPNGHLAAAALVTHDHPRLRGLGFDCAGFWVGDSLGRRGGAAVRGLTKEEAALLANSDARERGLAPVRVLSDREKEIREALAERGAVGPLIVVAGVRQKYATRRPVTPLGKLALRVHQLCVERGLA